MIGRRAALALLLMIAGPADAEPLVPKAQSTKAEPYTIAGTERWNITSAISGRTYRVSVYRPTSKPPAGGFPVFFTTDADIFFPMAAGSILIRSLGELRPAVIVGISYPTDDPMEIIRLRTRDLTPKPMTEDVLKEMKGLGVTAADGGGAELFYRFITEELRPELARRYPIDESDQTLFGHSLGGLFSLHVLFNHPTAFRSYVAASPSIAWSDAAILRDVPEFKKKLAGLASPPNLLLLVGGDESNPDAMPITAMPREDAAKKMAQYPMVGNMTALADRLRSTRDGPAWLVESFVFAVENHLSVQPASLARAMSFALALPTWGKPCVAPCAKGPAN